MKKLMAVLLGLSFVLGSATIGFAADKDKTTKKQRKAKPRKAKKVKNTNPK
jgi:hypothetical protein